MSARGAGGRRSAISINTYIRRMTTTLLPAAVGIDVSKDTFTAAFDESRVQEFPNTEDGVGEFLACARTHGLTRETLIGMEPTGVYHIDLCLYLKAYGVHPVLINPLIVRRYGQLSLRKTKTDPTDARTVRKAVQNGEGYPFSDTRETVALRAVVAERSGLAELKQSLKTRRHAHVVRSEAARGACPDLYAPVLREVETRIRQAEKTMRQYETDTQQLLQSIPGIGPTAAATLVAVIGDPHRFDTAAQFIAFVGLDPSRYQSGTSIDSNGAISKRGNAALRSLLYHCAFMASYRDAEFAAYYRRKRAEGRHHVEAVCALERKLCTRIFAVWRRGTPFVSTDT